MSAKQRGWREWLLQRTGLAGAGDSLSTYRVPFHRLSVLSALGRLTAMLFVVQVASGILLLLYYRPSMDEARQSVGRIMGDIPFGDLIHGVHVWAGDLFIGCLLAHLFAVMILRAYRPPRELTWVSGSLLFVIGIGFGLTGHLLPWTDSSYLAARVSTQLAAHVPVAGHFLKVFLRGGEELTATSLTRCYGFHVAILPAAMSIAVFAHVWLVRRLGMSVPPSLRSAPTIAYWPHEARRDEARGTLLLMIVLSLAVLVPRELGPKADALAPAPDQVRPEWYFLWIFQFIKGLPPKLGGISGDTVAVSVLLVCLALFVGLPALDRRGSKLVAVFGGLLMVGFLGATFYGLR